MNIIIKICSVVTDFASSPVLFVLILLWLVILYIFLPIDGYAKWNAGIGLFGNTNGSNFELITGAGSMVMLGIAAKDRMSRRKEAKAHHEEIKQTHLVHDAKISSLHTKLDKLLQSKGVNQ